MRFLVFLSFVSVLSSTVAVLLLGDSDDLNLFFDSADNSLFPDDTNELSINYGNSDLDQVSLLDENSNVLDWTGSTELAGVGDFCAADGEIQTIGRIRARNDHASCRSSDQNINLLNFPKIGDFFKKKQTPSTEPIPKTEVIPPIAPAPPQENACELPYDKHLCCVEPGPNSLNIVNGEKFHNTMESCTPGTSPKRPLHVLCVVDFN